MYPRAYNYNHISIGQKAIIGRQKGNGMVSVVTTKVKEVSAYDRHSNEAHSSKR